MSEPNRSSAAPAPATVAESPPSGAARNPAAHAPAPYLDDVKPADQNPTMRVPDAEHGLASMRQVIELADHLSACADALHARIVTEIRQRETSGAPDQQAMRSLLEDEMLLRQRANGLYADAATYVVRDLGRSQDQLIALTADAAQKIRRIGVIGETAGLIGALLALAGAVVSLRPDAIVLALDKMRLHSTSLQALNPAPPPVPG